MVELWEGSINKLKSIGSTSLVVGNVVYTRKTIAGVEEHTRSFTRGYPAKLAARKCEYKNICVCIRCSGIEEYPTGESPVAAFYIRRWKFILCARINMEFKFEELNRQYKRACREETKKKLNNMINNFVDDENKDKDYKDKIINIVVELLTLK